jgi:hypothetical protein
MPEFVPRRIDFPLLVRYLDGVTVPSSKAASAGRKRLPALLVLSVLLAALCCLLTCAPEKTPEFTHSTQITNTFLPLTSLHQDTLVGAIGDDTVLVVRTMTVGTRTFTVGDEQVTAAIREDRVYHEDELSEVTLDYFAQSDAGTVYALGADVNIYDDGRVIGHEGSWLYASGAPGIYVPATPQVGDTFSPADVAGSYVEHDRIESLTATLTLPAGQFTNCLQVAATDGSGNTWSRYFAPGVGTVQDVVRGVAVRLKAHH